MCVPPFQELAAVVWQCLHAWLEPSWVDPNKGCFLLACRWDKEEGVLKASAPNELRQALPVIQVKPVTQQEYSLQGYYECPVYTNMQRANVYSAAVSSFTLKTAEPAHKWVLASVAILLQDDLTA